MGGHGRRTGVIPLTRAAVPVTPKVLASLERFSAALAGVGSRRRVDSLVKADRRRVLEGLTTHATLARVLVAMLVQVVLLQMHLIYSAK